MKEDIIRWKNFIMSIQNYKDIYEDFLRNEDKYFFRIGWIGPNFPLPGGSFCKCESEIADKIKTSEAQPSKMVFDASSTNPQTKKPGKNPIPCKYGDDCSFFKRGECTFTH